jgi:hypothetical protein
MAKNILFLIHGVGDQDTGWSKSVQEFLAEEIKLYPSFKGESNPLSTRLKFEEIVYNDIFDDILRGWRSLTEQFDAVDDELMPGVLRSVNTLIGQMAGNGSQLRNNQLARRAADVLLYRGLTLVQRLVLLRVVSRIATVIARELQSAGTKPIRFGVLAHSLGTTVAHDAMQVMATTSWLRKRNGALREFKDIDQNDVIAADAALGDFSLSASNFRFRTVYMISNTSPLLYTTKKDPYTSIVRPRFGSRHPGNTHKYVNVNHKFDPIGMVRPMDISRWPGASARKGAIDLRPRHVHELNVHDLVHYLRDPQVHGHLFLDLVDGFKKDDYGYALMRRDPQSDLVADPFPRYKGKFAKEGNRANLESRIKEEVYKKLVSALNVVARKVPS